MKDIETNIFNFKTINLPVRCGSVIVAQPFLSESWFSRGVISLLDYKSTDGATGVVMNNLVNYTLDEVLDGVDAGREVPVYCGGPLGQDRLYFVHSLGDGIIPGGREYAEGLYIGGDFNKAIEYVNEGYPVEGAIRFFIGYSGWSRDQLEDEIKRSTWAVCDVPLSAQYLLEGDGDPYWHKIVRKMGPKYRSWQLIPEDLHSN